MITRAQYEMFEKPTRLEREHYERTNVPHLVKCPRTNVIINENIGELQRLKAARNKDRASKDEIKELRKEMQEFRDGMNEILMLLRKQNV